MKKDGQGSLDPGVERALDAELNRWSDNHGLSHARMARIHRQVLAEVAPSFAPLPQEWWQNLARSLRSAQQVSLNLGPAVNRLARISTTG